jgi:hypothetical protein
MNTFRQFCYGRSISETQERYLAAFDARAESEEAPDTHSIS